MHARDTFTGAVGDAMEATKDDHEAVGDTNEAIEVDHEAICRACVPE